MKRDLIDQWALVTGASSGFGIEFAELLAARGANLLLVARREAPMRELGERLQRQHGIEVRVLGIDLARPQAVAELKAFTDSAGLHIDILINNAGYGLFGDFLSQPLARTRDMLQLNMLTLTELSHLYGDAMRARKRGHILLIASIGGYQATPSYAAYSASKAYVLLFGEALNQELKADNVKVSVLSPGITATAFLQVSGQRPTLYQRLLMMRAKPVAQIGLRALFAGKASVVPGVLNQLTVLSNRLTPRSIQSKLAYQLMKN